MMRKPAASSTANSLLLRFSLFDVSNFNQLDYYADFLCYQYIKFIFKSPIIFYPYRAVLVDIAGPKPDVLT